MAELAPGSQFGGYRIEAIAGRGGMGVVYRATQPALERTVALKLITPYFADDPEFRERFKRESRLAASIEHPNVIPVYEAGEHDGVLFLAMRYVEGTDLGSLLEREGRLDPLRAARFVAHLAAALDAAHEAGLVHRDVKPANALVAGHDHVYLTDFGLTKRAASASALTKTGQMVGTVDYVAPEQVEGGSVDARTDVYSLGCVLYHLLTGRVPYDKPSELAKLFAHVNDPPPVPSASVPGLPLQLDEVVARGMAKRAEDRYPSAGDLGRAALAAAEHRLMAEPERSVARGAAAPAPARLADAATELGPWSPAAVETSVDGDAGAAAVPQGRDVARPKAARLWAAAAAAVVVLGVVIVIVLVTGRGGGSSAGDDSAGAFTVAGGKATPVPLTRALGLGTVSTFADYYTDENLGGLEELFATGFEQTINGPTCTGSKSPMDIDAALAEYQCRFENLLLPNVETSGVTVDLATRTATGSYTVTDSGKATGSGTFKMHLVPQAQDAQPKIDRLELTGS